MHHWIQVDPYSSSELETVSSALHLNMDPTAIRKIVQFRYRFDIVIAHDALAYKQNEVRRTTLL